MDWSDSEVKGWEFSVSSMTLSKRVYNLVNLFNSVVAGNTNVLIDLGVSFHVVLIIIEDNLEGAIGSEFFNISDKSLSEECFDKILGSSKVEVNDKLEEA